MKALIATAGVALLLAGACTAKSPDAAQRAIPPQGQAYSSSSEAGSTTAGNVLPGVQPNSPYLSLLLEPPYFEDTSVIENIALERDLAFVPVLLDTMNSPNAFIWIHAIARALKDLTSQDFGYDWAAWVEWYARQHIQPVSGYVSWKGQYLGLIDPKFKEYFYEGVKHRIPIDKIVWGGVRKDGIPALNHPKLVGPQEATYLAPEEPVFGISINGDHRAYPLRMMDWHELFNDVVGGVPVSLSYCTLCGAGILYDTTVRGHTFTFGSSGLLYQSNKLMYDYQTNSLWNNLTGEPVLGSLADSGLKLTVLPVTVSRWSDWLAVHRDTKVLSLDTGYTRDYTPGRPYGPYFASPNTMFPVTERSERLPTKTWVYAMTLNGVPKAYPLEIFSEMPVLNDTLAGIPLVLVSTAGGREVRAYNRGQHQLRAVSLIDLVDEAGVRWVITEDALIPEQSTEEKLARLPGHLAFWFGWYVFFPNTLVYERQQ